MISSFKDQPQPVILLLLVILFSCSQEKITPHSSTFLGNDERNYYGNEAPDKLDTIWKLYLGEGISPAYGNPNKLWKGAGWTGQPLIIEENKEIYLIIGAFDYNLKKIHANTGQVVWQYRFDDILKGTGTFCVNTKATLNEEKYMILQGSRRGVKNKIDNRYCPSFRSISYLTGKELWRINIKQTHTYSRDVDGSALVIDDTGYLAFENGLFTIFDINPQNQRERDGMMQPEIMDEIRFYTIEDTIVHGGNIESESSPCLLGTRIFTTAGSGRVYGYNLTKKKVDWIFEIGADLNGSPTVTSDSCLLIPVEKQYIEGQGGVFKINPSMPPEKSVVWYFPVGDSTWFHWEGGIIGSIAINDSYITSDTCNLATFIGVDGYLYVVNHKKKSGQTVLGPNKKNSYPTPELVYKEKTGGTISTPIITKEKLIAPLDAGLILYHYDSSLNFFILDKIDNIQIDATPVVWNKKLYVASLDGYLYCFGEK